MSIKEKIRTLLGIPDIEASVNDVLMNTKDLKQYYAENLSWVREYHRLYLQDQARYEHRKVWAFYIMNIVTREERLYQVADNEYMDAYTQLFNLLKLQMVGGSQDWMVKATTFIDLPLPKKEDVQNSLDRAEGKMPEEGKPVGVYLNNLQYAHDFFATTKGERETLTGIITKIKKKYE